MNRNTRTLIVLAVAVLMAGIASFGVYMAVRSMPVREVEIARVQAVVAARPLMVGTLVTKDDVKVVPWPAANKVPGSFTEVERVVNRGVVGSLAENEPLTESQACCARLRGGPSANHHRGHAGVVDSRQRDHRRGRLRDPRHPSGRPGDRSGGQEGQVKDEAQTRVVLSNVQVLTAGTRYDQERATKDGKPIKTSVVTLLLTPQDAETLTLASAKGRSC